MRELLEFGEAPVWGRKIFRLVDELLPCNIGPRSERFNEQFLDTVVENVPEGLLEIFLVRYQPADSVIIRELAGRAKTELAHFFYLLARQSIGLSGFLSVGGCANVSYSLGKDGKLWRVQAMWRGQSWALDALPTQDAEPSPLLVGTRVFIHKPMPKRKPSPNR